MNARGILNRAEPSPLPTPAAGVAHDGTSLVLHNHQAADSPSLVVELPTRDTLHKYLRVLDRFQVLP